MHMSHLSSAETKCYFYPVTFGNKLPGCVHLCVQIIGINIGRQTDFFDFDRLLLLPGLLFLSGLLVSLLSIIHNLADGRFCRGSDLHQIQACILCQPESLLHRHYTKLLPIFTNNTYLFVPNLLVNK